MLELALELRGEVVGFERFSECSKVRSDPFMVRLRVLRTGLGVRYDSTPARGLDRRAHGPTRCCRSDCTNDPARTGSNAYVGARRPKR